jgi:hypothetical protein
LCGQRGQGALHQVDALGDPAVVRRQPLGGGDLLREPQRGILDTAAGLVKGDIKEGTFQGGPADLVGLEHAAVDQEQAGPGVGASRGAAEGIVEPLGLKLRG